MQVGGSCVRFSQVGTLRHLRCHLLCEVLSNFSQCLLVFLLASIALSSYPIIAFITLLLVSFTKYSYLRTETHIFIFVSLVLIISLFLACSYLSVILPHLFLFSSLPCLLPFATKLVTIYFKADNRAKSPDDTPRHLLTGR